jgi:hypothetical protein
MRHLDDGILRRMVDEPLSISDSQWQHGEQCARCRERQARIAADAHQVAGLLAVPSGAIDPSTALSRFHRRVAGEGIQPARRPSRWTEPLARSSRRLRTLGSAATVVALVSVLSLTPARSLAHGLLTLFQPTQLQTVQTTTSELRSLRALRAYGTLSGAQAPPVEQVANATAAGRASGMTVLVPDRTVAGVPAVAPRYAVERSATASFTFSAARARAHARATGKPIPPMPANIDGSTLQVTIGTAVLTQYRDAGQDIPGLLIGQMRAPSVRSTGVSVKALEDFVLSLPEVPAALAAQIRNIDNPSSTLPIPIPVDLANAHQVDVQGVQGIEVGDNTGLGSGVVWEKDGIVYVVAGPLTDSQALAIAQSLH